MDPYDPFTPAQNSAADPSTFEALRNQWSSFLSDPQGRAALLSAGLTMMQPQNFGEDTFSQLGRAIGAAGESATANEAMDLKKQEAESKADLRGAQATAAESRAATAGARADTSAANLTLKQEQLKAANERNLLGNRVRLSGMYQNYVKDVAQRNQSASLLNPGAPPEPILPIGDWIKQNPMLKNLGLVGNDISTTETPTETPTTAAPSGLPPEAAGRLREGTITTFGNGQRWTLRGGVPTRVP